ncbi:MAG: 4Fe-4S binding protein [Candidatus Hodarchaeales archaeon]
MNQLVKSRELTLNSIEKKKQGKKAAVFVCHCGSNIAGIVDVKKVVEEISKMPEVAIAKEYLYMCSDPGQALIIEEFEGRDDIDGVVVAACSPRLHEKTFRNVMKRGEKNPYLFEQANIREHDSWVHMDDKDWATKKAIQLTRSAIYKNLLLEELETKEVPVHPSAMVAGGGIAGLTAAREILRKGFEVHLIERNPFLGGRVPFLSRTFPTLEPPRPYIDELIKDLLHNSNFHIYTSTRLKEQNGYVGNFELLLQESPTCVNDNCNLCGECIKVCPEKWRDEENGREYKAIYRSYPEAYPNKYAINLDACTRCEKCVEKCEPGAIDLNMQLTETEIKAGVIITAVGTETYKPTPEDPWQSTELPQVISAMELEALLSPDGSTGGKLQTASGKKPESMAFIQCVGSRDVNRNPYCSRVCCLYTAKQAHHIKKNHPEIDVRVFYMDMRSMGKQQEEFWADTQQLGVHYIRCRVPEVRPHPTNKDKVMIVAEDTLSADPVTGETTILQLDFDMVVLATGLQANSDLKDYLQVLNLGQTPDGFLLELHPKLGPVDTPTKGIFISGTCQGPKDISETIEQSKAAASSASILLLRGSVEIEPFIAEVDEDSCISCGICEKMCPYRAIAVEEKSVINPALCEGCGSCAAECPVGAIQLRHYKDHQIVNQIYALEPKPGEWEQF